MNEKGVYLGITGAGMVFAYAGLRGKSITKSIQAVVSGKSPASTPQTNAIVVPADTSSSGAAGFTGYGASDSAILNDAQKYLGVMYKWGGANPNGFDCSGLCNYVIGHDLNNPIPGISSGFQGTFHGPVTGQWFTTSLCTTVPLSACQPGDLIVWLTHMGIAADNGQHMLNAYSTGHPVAVTTISGMAPPGEPMRVRRYNGLKNVVQSGGVPQLPAGFGG